MAAYLLLVRSAVGQLRQRLEPKYNCSREPPNSRHDAGEHRHRYAQFRRISADADVAMPEAPLFEWHIQLHRSSTLQRQRPYPVHLLSGRHKYRRLLRKFSSGRECSRLSLDDSDSVLMSIPVLTGP